MKTLLMALASLAILNNHNVNASIYTKQGDGLCQPDGGTTYSYMLKRDYQRGSHAQCATSCDSVVESDASLEFYRGFSKVFKADIGPNIPNNSCLCFFDHHHFPEGDLQDGWEIYETGDGEGPIAGTDGSPNSGCYKMLVEDKVRS